MATALAALGDHGVDPPLEHLLGMASGADRRDAERAGIVNACDRVLRRRSRERHDADAFADHERDAAFEVRLVGAEVDSERGVGARLYVADGGPQLVVGHRDRREDAEPARRARGRGEPRAGDPAHPRLHDRPADAGKLTEPRVERRVQRLVLHFGEAGAVGVDRLFDDAQLLVGRHSCLADVVR